MAQAQMAVIDGRMSHASPISHASKSFPRRRESSGVRVMTGFPPARE